MLPAAFRHSRTLQMHSLGFLNRQPGTVLLYRAVCFCFFWFLYFISPFFQASIQHKAQFSFGGRLVKIQIRSAVLWRSVPGHLCALPHRRRGKSGHGLISFPSSSLSSYGSFRFCGGSHFLSLRFPHPVLQSFPYAGIVKELCNISSVLFQPLSVTAQDRCERKDFYCNLFVIFASSGEKFRLLYPTIFKIFAFRTKIWLRIWQRNFAFLLDIPQLIC